MVLPVLKLKVPQNGYSVQYAESTRRVSVGGGFTRQRADFIGRPHVVNVNWSLTQLELQYFWAFYRSSIAHGSGWFQVDLRIDNTPAETYDVRFLEAPSLSGVEGYQNQVPAVLEVKPKAQDTVLDQSIIDLFNIYEGDLHYFLNIFEDLIDVHLPSKNFNP